jgi:nucleoside-diphosphate-sugar epimerase
MRYLVTGGAGFIGSNIVATLLEKGHAVRVLDNFTTGRRTNIESFLSDIDLVDGDIRDFWTCLDAAEGCDYILHQAALPSVQRSVINPQTTNEINIGGTLNMLEAARRRRVKRFVFASSSSVYGDTPTLPKIETMAPHPLSPYATTKLAGEFYCKNYHDLHGLPTVCLRYFNIFGPQQDPNSDYAAVVPKFVTALLAGRRPTVFGDGEQSRDFTYIQNAVQANLIACESEATPGGVFNIACGDRFTLNQMFEVLRGIIGASVEPIYVDPRPGDIKHALAEIEAAKNTLGYDPEIDFRRGLELTVEWYRKSENPVEISA